MPKKREDCDLRPFDGQRVRRSREDLGLVLISGRCIGSKAILRARLTGLAPAGAGTPGDLLHGSRAIADYLNTLFSAAGAVTGGGAA